jgi:hypothetical protein
MRNQPLVTSLTVRLLVFLALNALALNLLLGYLAPSEFSTTGFGETLRLLKGYMEYDDSWRVMDAALGHLQSGSDLPLYTEVFFNQHQRFQYPPSALLPYLLIQGSPDAIVYLGWCMVAITIISVAALLNVRLRQRGQHLVSPLLVLAFAISFYPLAKAFTLGQVQLWINSIFAVALLAWATGYRAASGLLIGTIALLKPHYALFLIWAALRREWRFAIACLATGAAGLAVSVAFFGFFNHIDYISVLSYISQHGESYHPNQSFNGLLNRIVGIWDDRYNNLDWVDDQFPPFNRVVFYGTYATSILILAAALLRVRRLDDEDRVFDFSTMAVSLTIASPIAWEHHYGILLPAYAVLFVAALGNVKAMVWLGASYVLTSNFLQITNALWATGFNFAQSYLLFGALIVLALLHLAPFKAQMVAPAPRPSVTRAT